MENSVKVSVVIPVYNVEKYLRECVDSVLKQTYSSYEIILVDDGSTDSSGVICDTYAQKDKRITAIHIKNGGPSVARNEGLKLARGEFVCFLDSDDYIESEAFEKLVDIVERSFADLVFFDAISFADDGSVVKQGYLINSKYEPSSGCEILTELYDNGDYHCSVVLLFVRKSLMEKSQIKFLETAFCSEDLLFSYKVFCSAQKVVQCEKTLYHRRYRPNSIVTSKKSERYFSSCCYVYNDIKNYSKERGLDNSYIAKEFIVRCAFNCFNIYEKLSKNDKKENKKKIKAISDDILKNNAFGNKALQMRCYGKIFWVIYKLVEIPFMKRR